MTPRAPSVVVVGLAIAAVASCRAPSVRRNADASLSVGEVPVEALASTSSTTNMIALGRQLFEDVTLSRDSTISCATCHIPHHAFAEPRDVSHGIGLRARKRNTPSLINVVVSRTNFDWDGRAATLDEQLRGVFSATGDMGIDLGEAVARLRDEPGYNTHFLRSFGRRADVDGLIAALIAFQGSLVVVDSRFDRFYFGGDSLALSESEKRGWQLFRSPQSGCAGCHTPLPVGAGIPLFSDGRFHNLGVGYSEGRMADVGRYGVTLLPSDWGRFRTPSLRNVALTAPYMHDGSLATLDDVIQFYGNGGVKNPNLDAVMVRRRFSDQDRQDLVAFLRALTTTWLSVPDSVTQRLLPPTQLDKNAHFGRGAH